MLYFVYRLYLPGEPFYPSKARLFNQNTTTKDEKINIKLPEIRSNLLMQEFNDALLIYDQTINKSYCLNSTAKTVFNACNGVSTVEDLKSHLPESVIYLSLNELKRNNLLASRYVSPFVGMSRRSVIKKVGLATMVALPVVAGIISPQAANVASGGNLALLQTCTASSQCTSNRCLTTNSGTRRCCVLTITNQPQEPGTNLGGTSNATCTNIIGPQYCCSGSATNNPNGTAGCVCN